MAFAGNLTRGFRYTALEIRCAIRLQQQRPVRVLLAAPWLDRVELLSHDNTTDMLAGELVPNHQRAVQSRNPAFPVLLRQGINIFTLRMDSPGSGMILPLELQDEAVFAPTDSRENWLLGGFFGFISSLAVISVVFRVFSRDPIFFVYALGLVANLALFFIQFGLPAILFGFAGPLLNTLTVVLTAVTVMFFTEFHRQYLRIISGPGARLLRAACAAGVVIGAMAVFAAFPLSVRISLFFCHIGGPLTAILSRPAVAARPDTILRILSRRLGDFPCRCPIAPADYIWPRTGVHSDAVSLSPEFSCAVVAVHSGVGVKAPRAA